MDKQVKNNPVGSDFNEHLEFELKDPELAAYYINAAVEENDPSFLKIALGKVVKIHGPTEIAKMTNLNRESLYKMLSSGGNPGLENVIEILGACGLEISIQPKEKKIANIKSDIPYVLKEDLDEIIATTTTEAVRKAFVHFKRSEVVNVIKGRKVKSHAKKTRTTPFKNYQIATKKNGAGQMRRSAKKT